MKYKCLLCQSKSLKFKYFLKKSVTSDCIPFEYGCTLLLCENCGHTQKKITTEWKKNTSTIYNNYNSFNLADTDGQIVFIENKPHERGQCLLNLLSKNINFKNECDLLDFGCGNGHFLNIVNRNFKSWNLYGYDLNEKEKENILIKANVKDFYFGNLKKINHKFNYISLLHVIEHLVDPVKTLTNLKKILKKDGRLIIEIPNYTNNYLDLTIYDHCSHFTPTNLTYLLSLAGYKIDFIEKEWLGKETIVCASVSSNNMDFELNIDDSEQNLDKAILYLKKISQQILKNNINAIYGTTISGNYLSGILNNNIKYYIDDDTSKHGKKINGAPIISLTEAPSDTRVFIPFSEQVVKSMRKKIKSTNPKIKSFSVYD